MSDVSANAKSKRNCGFTLIELMVVTAIIGLLAAVAIPSFLEYLERTKASEAAINLKDLAQAGKAYYMIHHRLPTPPDYTPAALPSASKYVLRDVWDEFNSSSSASGVSWTALGWTPAEDFYFAYSFTHDCGTDECAADTGRFEVHARGDLDGDGDTSHYYRYGSFAQGQIIMDNLVSLNPNE